MSSLPGVSIFRRFLNYQLGDPTHQMTNLRSSGSATTGYFNKQLIKVCLIAFFREGYRKGKATNYLKENRTFIFVIFFGWI